MEVFHPDPAAIRDDPEWPGEEVPRSRLPVVLGRVGPAGGRRVVLSGHVDVVPPGDPATWTVDPWSAEVRDGRLFGRGACDMKGGVAAILGAVRALRDAGTLDALAGELVVALVPSEEDGGQGTLAAIRAGATGDLAIIAEPSGLDIVVAHAGAITFRLTVPGPRRPREPPDARACPRWRTCRRSCRRSRPTRRDRNAAETEPLMTDIGLPYPTIIGIVAGGEWASTVMDRVTADGRYGVRLGQTPEAAADELRACIAAACAADPFLRDHPATVEITGARFASSSVPAGHRLVTGLSAAACAGTGRTPRAIGVPYGCDMRLFIGGRRDALRGVRPGRRPAGARGRRVGAPGRGRGVRPRAGDLGLRGDRPRLTVPTRRRCRSRRPRPPRARRRGAGRAGRGPG